MIKLKDLLTEKQFKGLDGIPDKTPLSKISNDQKLKIIKAKGNIIDFIVPKGEKRNFWQVIGTGNIKKTSDGEFYLEGKVINSPMFKSISDLVDGVKWDSMEERRKFNQNINEAKSDFETYHKSYTSAINAAREYAEKKGYEINDDDAFTKIGMGPKKPSEGKTNRFSIELSKDGKPSRKQLHIQVYGMRNSYELNAYIQ